MIESIEKKRVEPQLSNVEIEDQNDRIAWGVLIKYLLLTIVAMFLLLVFVDKVAMPWYVKLGAVETVPNVVGMTFAQAESRLEKAGFEVKKGEPRFSDQFAAGTVVMQLPYGGAQTKQGRRIYLNISRGAEVTPMLDLIGMPLREARIALMRQGLDIGETNYDYNDTIMRDLIYAQSIPARVGIRPGTVVDVMISRGPSTRFTMMPNLIALDVETARVRVENAGLVLGIVRYREDETYVPNTVIEQAVSPYAQVAEGAAIDITIAKAPGTTPEGTSQAPPNGNLNDAGPQVRNLNSTTPARPVAPMVAPRPFSPKPAAPKPSAPKTTKPAAPKTNRPAVKPAGTKTIAPKQNSPGSNQKLTAKPHKPAPPKNDPQ
jgi:beta-lactam-binding protein with PASTA domain